MITINFINIFRREIQHKNPNFAELEIILKLHFMQIDFQMADRSLYDRLRINDLFSLFKENTNSHNKSQINSLKKRALSAMVEKYKDSINDVEDNEKLFVIKKFAQNKIKGEEVEDLIEEATFGVFDKHELSHIYYRDFKRDDDKFSLLLSPETLDFMRAGASKKAVTNLINLMPKSEAMESFDKIFNYSVLYHIVDNNLMFLINWKFENLEHYEDFDFNKFDYLEKNIQTLEEEYFYQSKFHNIAISLCKSGDEYSFETSTTLSCWGPGGAHSGDIDSIDFFLNNDDLIDQQLYKKIINLRSDCKSENSISNCVRSISLQTL